MKFADYVDERVTHYKKLVENGESKDECRDLLMIDLYFPLVDLEDEPHSMKIDF